MKGQLRLAHSNNKKKPFDRKVKNKKNSSFKSFQKKYEEWKKQPPANGESDSRLFVTRPSIGVFIICAGASTSPRTACLVVTVKVLSDPVSWLTAQLPLLVLIPLLVLLPQLTNSTISQE